MVICTLYLRITNQACVNQNISSETYFLAKLPECVSKSAKFQNFIKNTFRHFNAFRTRTSKKYKNEYLHWIEYSRNIFFYSIGCLDQEICLLAWQIFEKNMISLIHIAGDNGSSWGWDIGSKESIHNGQKTNYPPTGTNTIILNVVFWMKLINFNLEKILFCMIITTK